MRNFTACMSAALLCSGFASAATAADATTSPVPMPMPQDTAMPMSSNATMPGHVPAPISVMGAHLHKPGQVMFTYRYMHMDMRQLADGDDDLSTSDVATMRNHNAGRPGQPATWRSAPENMTMDMHMLGMMAGVTNDLTMMAMIPYVTKQAEMVTFAGPAGTTELGTSKNETSGFGDASLSALYRLYDDATNHVHLSAGVSFPTGSITQSGRMLMPTGMVMKRRLPYGMQLGTGTYNLLPGLTYTGGHGHWNWGAQALGQIPLGDNDEGYRFGNSAYGTGWIGYSVGWGFNLSTRLAQSYAGKINGNDNDITGASPTADPDNYGGWKTSAAFGVNYKVFEGPLKGLNPGVEVSVPIYQYLNGPQLKESWSVSAGVRKTFTF